LPAGALLVAAACEDDAPSFSEREGTGSPGRSYLANTMSEVSGGVDTDIPQRLDNADLNREEQWLCNIGTCDGLGVYSIFKKLSDRQTELWPKYPIHLFDSGTSYPAGACRMSVDALRRLLDR
jgi:hypothetical protein